MQSRSWNAFATRVRFFVVQMVRLGGLQSWLIGWLVFNGNFSAQNRLHHAKVCEIGICRLGAGETTNYNKSNYWYVHVYTCMFVCLYYMQSSL